MLVGGIRAPSLLGPGRDPHTAGNCAVYHCDIRGRVYPRCRYSYLLMSGGVCRSVGEYNPSSSKKESSTYTVITVIITVIPDYLPY